jgi:hypothetical protein
MIKITRVYYESRGKSTSLSRFALSIQRHSALYLVLAFCSLMRQEAEMCLIFCMAPVLFVVVGYRVQQHLTTRLENDIIQLRAQAEQTKIEHYQVLKLLDEIDRQQLSRIHASPDATASIESWSHLDQMSL